MENKFKEIFKSPLLAMTAIDFAILALLRIKYMFYLISTIIDNFYDKSEFGRLSFITNLESSFIYVINIVVYVLFVIALLLLHQRSLKGEPIDVPLKIAKITSLIFAIYKIVDFVIGIVISLSQSSELNISFKYIIEVFTESAVFVFIYVFIKLIEKDFEISKKLLTPFIILNGVSVLIGMFKIIDLFNYSVNFDTVIMYIFEIVYFVLFIFMAAKYIKTLKAISI